MNPYEKVRLVDEKHHDALDLIRAELRNVLRAKRNGEWKYLNALRLLDKAMVFYAPHSPCKKGCAFCCHQAVTIFHLEAKRIENFTKQKMNEFVGHGLGTMSPEQRTKQISSYTGKVCPFLKNNECSIYEVRPMTCRGHLSLDDDALNCDVVTRPGARVPYVNVQPWEIEVAWSLLNEGQTVGDIREFFGEVK